MKNKQISLAVKYRPKTFDDVVEQEAIKDILIEQIETNSFKHAYLFCGPAGCGKTTAARIFANELNKRKGNPIEVDAASNNGVDNIREIIDNAKRKALDSEYKVYIIDEVHMLSIGAWNAMLKLLEEPPAGTIFIMCTTDPQKIPATILSRVQRYDFTKISLDNIVNRLRYIIEQEAEELCNETGNEFLPGDPMPPEAEDGALEYIAKLAEGGMRDAITMLDKCLSLSPTLTVETVVKALGTVNYTVYFELLYQLASRNALKAVEVIETVYNSGKDIKQFIKQFQFFVLDVCKYQMFESFKYIAIPELPEYKTKMEDEDYDDCLKILDWARQLNADIKWESNAKAMIETAILVFCKEE
ncbi:MAG TPA: AAA family ATPase [Fervidobacterium sp.]|nr:AAA family ATPase [Fervidobacterium sp.]